MSDLMHWRREERIMRFCADRARQIIAELETSHGEYGDHVQELTGLIEEWEYMALVADEARRKAGHQEYKAGRL